MDVVGTFSAKKTIVPVGLSFLGVTFWVPESAVPVIVAFLGVLAVRSKNGKHDGTVRCVIFVAGQIICAAGRSIFFFKFC